jgi:hypothetical protein
VLFQKTTENGSRLILECFVEKVILEFWPTFESIFAKEKKTFLTDVYSTGTEDPSKPMLAVLKLVSKNPDLNKSVTELINCSLKKHGSEKKEAETGSEGEKVSGIDDKRAI